MLRKTSKKSYTYLTLWSWLLQKLTVAQSLKKLPAFLQDSKVNLPSSQDPATVCPYVPDESSPNRRAVYSLQRSSEKCSPHLCL